MCGLQTQEQTFKEVGTLHICSVPQRLNQGMDNGYRYGLDTNYDVLHTTKYKLVCFEMYLKYDEYGHVKHEKNMRKNHDNRKKNTFKTL